jgi:two-component system NtrC family sensor kinase
MRLRNLSWRLKVPIAITAVILITEIVVTGLLVSRALSDSRRDLEYSADSLTTVLASSLREPILRDDVWQGFEIITKPIEARRSDNPLKAVVVLDASDAVFVSSEPKRIPISMRGSSLPAPLPKVASTIDVPDFTFVLGTGASGPELAAAKPIVTDDGIRLGTVLLEFDGEMYATRVRSAIVNVALISVPGLLLLIPLGWYAGKRLAEPLAQITQVLARVSHDPPDQVMKLLPPESGDELGQLSAQARLMLNGLARKSALEQEVMASDRLAAIGRVSAAIAHEINNPLGGMLNAIDTALKHGQPDALSKKTFGLLGRGIEQIRSTVEALLVEARLNSPQLRDQDWEDLLLLVQPNAMAQNTQLLWSVEPSIHGHMSLPAHEIRQLTLNLLLNAMAAAKQTDKELAAVELTVANTPGWLAIVVGNTGQALSAERIGQMFEPFVAADPSETQHRHGLGLWICWQIVQRMGGNIQVSSDEQWTRVSVSLPIEPSHNTTG